MSNKGEKKVPGNGSGNGQHADEREPETIDGETGKPDASPRLKLSDLRDVRIEMANVYRGMKSGEIPSHEGTKRAYVLHLIADVIERGELEKRIAELEEAAERRAALQGGGQFHSRPRALN